MNIQLNNTVLIVIYCDSNIIFDNTTNLLRINLVSPNICNSMTFSIVPTNNINTNTNKFIILPLSSYQIDGYYQSDNTNTRAIAIASIVIICITTLVLIFFVTKFITNKQYQSFH
jgi:ABC-type phosphate transport system permease subunit